MKRVAYYHLIVVLVATAAVFSACGKEPVSSPDPPSEPDPVLPVAEGWAELPVMEEIGGVRYVTHWVSSDGSAKAGSDTPGRVRNYTIAFDVDTRQPVWVAYPMHSWYDGDAGRSGYWRADPCIPAGEQPDLRTSYNAVGDNGAFSRGHLLASDCRQRSRAMNGQTFYYTNSAPQTQNAFNGGIWLKLENLEKEWGFRGMDAADTLYVVTGSTFVGGEPFKVTSDDRGDEIPVPSHFYKALLTTKGTGVGKQIARCTASELKCVVFYLEHFGHANNERPGVRHIMSVADLESVTGMEFFPMIPEEAESVKDSFNVSEWIIQ